MAARLFWGSRPTEPDILRLPQADRADFGNLIREVVGDGLSCGAFHGNGTSQHPNARGETRWRFVRP